MFKVSAEQAVVADFETVEDLKAGLEAKARFEHVDLYHRDGSVLLGHVEKRLANLAGVIPENILAYNSGMSAVTDAIDVALHLAESDNITLACSVESYTQTKRYIEHFIRGKRANVIYFDSGSAEEVKQIIENRKPDVFVAETVANYTGVPVLDVEALLNTSRKIENGTTFVLDHTLPLSTGYPLGEKLDENDRVIVVESGTKSYTFNTALLGVAYTKDLQLVDWLRRYRRTRGSLPGPEHLEKIDELLPISREAFDERNRALQRNTGEFAVRLAELKPIDAPFCINHPNIPTHENHELYKTQYPSGGSPVVYIESSKLDQYEIAKLLEANAEVMRQSTFGQSFGFDHTRIVADENIAAVRIAGGSETDGVELAEACAEALFG